ncbi:hypothetical protein [uncultured Zoogloea sp.]|uniref:hypothetical protein n=1 Tax=uncultured Zoogloea sp. TaxID=160237 RepID=UPI002634D312|nr:hypothetical protein [uncultured Zoogloea sp.]
MSNTESAAIPWLDRELSDDELFLAKRVAWAVHCPAAGQGFLVAFSLAIDSLEALAQAWTQSSIDISQIVHALKSAHARLIASTTLPSAARSRPDLKPLSQSYALWHSSVEKARSNSDARRVRQALGLTLLWHMGKREKIGESISYALGVLVDCSARRGRHSPSWQNIIPLIKPESMVLEELAKAERHDPVAKLLRSLAGYAATCSLPVRPSTLSPYSNLIQQEHRSDLQAECNTGAEDRDCSNDKQEPAEEVLDKDQSIIRWQVARATRAPWPHVLGLENWDIFTPPLLKAAVAHIPGSFADQNVSAYAILSAVSMVSALPPRLALKLPLAQNNAIWIDLATTHICWSLAEIVPRTTMSEAIWAGGYRPSQIVRLPLPTLAANALNRKIVHRKFPSTLIELLFEHEKEEQEILSEYGAFLRSSRTTTEIPAGYAARIAYSFGAVVYQVSRNSVLTALTSLDLRLSAPAELDYLCISEDAITNAVSGAFEYLGFGECVATPDPRYVGSPFCPKPETLRNTLQKIREEMSNIVGRVTPRMPIFSFVKDFNRLSELSASAFVILSAHRGSKLERINFSSLYSSPKYFQVNDKLTKNNSTRIIPKTSSLNSLLNSHLAAIRSLGKRLAKDYPTAAERVNRIAGFEKPFAPVFFAVDVENGATLHPFKVQRQSIDDTDSGMAKNGGRHFIVSELVKRGVFSPLIRVITGHAREAAATFHAAAGLSPAEALECLRPFLEDVHADVAPADWPSLRQPSCNFPLVAIAPKARLRGIAPEIVIDDDFYPPPNLPKEPFHSQTLAFYSLGDWIVKELLSGSPGLSPWAVVFSSLMFVEILWQPSRIASAWASVSKKDVWRLGNTLTLRIERKNQQPIDLPLHPITTMMINAAWKTPIPTYLECVTQTASWISSHIPGNSWAPEPDSFMCQYSDIARAYHSIRLPPWLITAARTETEAAAISLSSISRIAYGRPGHSEPPKQRVLRKFANVNKNELLSQVIRIVNQMGDNTKQHGEDGARKVELVKRLRAWKETCGVSFGTATDVSDWIIEECRKRKSEKGHLEVSSLSTYLSRLRPFLEAVSLDDGLEDLSGNQWAEGRRLVLGELAGDSQKQASSIFRHFARFWRARGCIAISHDLIRDNPDEERIGQAHNASSTYVTSQEAKAIVEIVRKSFEAGSLNEARAALYAQLATSLPFRSAEVGLIHFQHTLSDLGMVEVTTSGYSHLKNPKSSRRRVPVPHAICGELSSLKMRLRTADLTSKGYFISTDTGSDCTHIADIKNAMQYALRSVTGEELVKQHSLRGSAECRLVWPGFEQAILSMQNCTPPPKMGRTPEERWNEVGLAAISAGHHPLSAIKYYLSMWPVFFYANNFQIYSTYRPRVGFARFLPEIKEDNFRQILSRSARRREENEVAKGSGEAVNEKNFWQELLSRSLFSSEIRLIEDLLQPTPRSQTSVAPNELRPASLALQISYVALRINGYTPESSADIFGLSAADSQRLDKLIPDLLSEDSNEPGISLKFAKAECPAMSSAIAECCDLERLRKALRATSSDKRNSTSPLTQIVETARILLSLIPSGLTLTVLPEADHALPQLRSALFDLDRAIEIKSRSLAKTTRYRFHIIPRENSRQGPRSQGQYTNLFRTLLRSQILLLSLGKNNDFK